jgi:DedD protein
MRLPFLRHPKSRSAPEVVRPAAAADDPGSVEAARTRARRRLVGALVLLAAGVLGFPVLFETQPRPLPLDTPIERARPAPPLPPERPAAVQPAARPLSVLPVLPADAGVEPAAATPAATVMAAPASAAPLAASAALPGREPEPVPVAAVAAAAAAAASASASTAAGSRYIVQVGAFGDAGALREARSRVEKLGLKTYVQVIDNDSGRRTRVRVGPYATREQAEAVAAKVKRSGLPAFVLAL